MSRHEGVSCDSCRKGNFRGKRFKCLICYDYDLCATCYENGTTTTRHTADHAMQCILTRTDFDVYYGGEAFTPEQPQSFTCPYCGKMGFTESALQEHVTSEHSDAAIEVVCPVCAALPGGDPNHVTDDLAAHLTLEHRAPRDIIYEEPGAARHVRRLFHPAVSGSRTRQQRPRAANMHFGGSGASSGLASSSASSSTFGRESMDPIAELLSQLSGVRRAAQQSHPPMQSQLQLLQQQLQLERQQVQQTRERLERLPARRQMAAAAAASNASATATVSTQDSSSSSRSSAGSSSFLLAKATESCLPESEQESLEHERADRSLFVQDLILSTLGPALFRKRTRPIPRDTELSEFTRLTLQENLRSQGGGAEHGTRAEARDCDVVAQGITVQDIEIISLETEEEKDS